MKEKHQKSFRIMLRIIEKHCSDLGIVLCNVAKHTSYLGIILRITEKHHSNFGILLRTDEKHSSDFGMMLRIVAKHNSEHTRKQFLQIRQQCSVMLLLFVCALHHIFYAMTYCSSADDTIYKIRPKNVSVFV